ncbi:MULTISPECIES: hypothetical protein [Paenibacillus]|uniref:hypothetical protein n=1 Tax=Paenibacillus TaxID=44249 RepID=UPI0011A477EC|nr:hypothetical protein [Paenibacillus xylanexedens]
MSRTDVEKLLADLNEGRILTQQTFEELDVEVYLDERDATAFADDWMQSFERWAQASNVAEEEVLRACREQAFKQTLAFTREPELAGYVSDDMGLIGAALLQGTANDSFVDQLLESYRQGRLPLR